MALHLNEEEWILTAEKFRSVLGSPAQDCTAATVISPLLKEAIKHYGHIVPPFLVRRANQKRVQGSVSDKTVTLAENYYLNHGESRQRKITYRKWNDTYGFWTLDLDGERLILKPIKGGPFGGARYIGWLNCLHGFRTDLIAHSPKFAHSPKSAHSRLKMHARGSVKRKKPGRDEFNGRFLSRPHPTPEAEDLLNGTPRPKRIAKTKAQIKIKDAVRNFLTPFIKSSNRSNEADGREISSMRSRHSRLEAPTTESPQHHSKSKLVQNHPNPPDPEAQPSLNGNHIDKQSLSSASAARRRVFFSTPEPTRVALSSKRTYDTFSATGLTDIAATLKRRREAFLHQSLPSSERMGEIGSATEPTHATAPSLRGSLTVLERDSNQSNLSDPESDVEDSPHGSAYSTSIFQDEFAEEPAQVSGASLEILAPLAAAEDPNSLDLLSPQKLSNTCLLISVPPDPDFKIAKLSSCATISDITTTILQPFRMENKIDQIDSIRFKFEWLPANACYRTLLIEPDQMSSSFDYVIKRIDKADLWATEGECCYLGVDILLKKGA